MARRIVVYSVKDCLTKGILELRGCVDQEGFFHQPNALLPSHLKIGEEAFESREEAVARANEIKAAILARFARQIKVFEEIEFS